MAIAPTINEQTTLLVTIAWFNEDDVAVTPSAASYRIDDTGTNQNLVPTTSISALSTTNTVTVTSTQNSSVDARSLQERVMTVIADYGSPSKRITDEYRWYVKNLNYVS